MFEDHHLFNERARRWTNILLLPIGHIFVWTNIDVVVEGDVVDKNEENESKMEIFECGFLGGETGNIY